MMSTLPVPRCAQVAGCRQSALGFRAVAREREQARRAAEREAEPCCRWAELGAELCCAERGYAELRFEWVWS